MDSDRFLTTYKDWDLESQLKSFPEIPIPTCIIGIEPEKGRTGYLEERGELIKDIWDRILFENSGLDGHRISWTEIIFFSLQLELPEFKKLVTDVLKLSIRENLKSIAVFSTLKGSIKEKIKEISKLDLQLTKIDFKDVKLFDCFYENGLEKELNSFKQIMINHIILISEYFMASSLDDSELQKLISFTKNKDNWVKAHSYFTNVRKRTIEANKSNQKELESLYRYIEICYKSLYNLTRSSAPFDPGSPYYIIPMAIRFCEKAKMNKQRIIEIISS